MSNYGSILKIQRKNHYLQIQNFELERKNHYLQVENFELGGKNHYLQVQNFELGRKNHYLQIQNSNTIKKYIFLSGFLSIRFCIFLRNDYCVGRDSICCFGSPAKFIVANVRKIAKLNDLIYFEFW